jgi:hypothetical protein
VQELISFGIGMVPVNDTYGGWPASGEIDIAESRGNDVDYPDGGRDIVSSSLHWGEYSRRIFSAFRTLV